MVELPVINLAVHLVTTKRLPISLAAAAEGDGVALNVLCSHAFSSLLPL